MSLATCWPCMWIPGTAADNYDQVCFSYMCRNDTWNIKISWPKLFFFLWQIWWAINCLIYDFSLFSKRRITGVSECVVWTARVSLLWRFNGREGVSNHQPHDCLLNRLFRHRSKKTAKLCVTGLFWGEFTGDTKDQWRGKEVPFDDVIMCMHCVLCMHNHMCVTLIICHCYAACTVVLCLIASQRDSNTWNNSLVGRLISHFRIT